MNRTGLRIRKTLNWIKNNYGDVTIYVTAGGVSDDEMVAEDTHREYIDEVLKGNCEQVFPQYEKAGENIDKARFFSSYAVEQYHHPTLVDMLTDRVCYV